MRARLRQVQPACLQPHAQTAQGLVAGVQQGLQAGRIAIGRAADDAGINAPLFVSGHHFAGLATLVIGDDKAIARLDANQDGAAAFDHVALGARRHRKHPRFDYFTGPGRTGLDPCVDIIEHRDVPPDDAKIASVE